MKQSLEAPSAGVPELKMIQRMATAATLLHVASTALAAAKRQLDDIHSSEVTWMETSDGYNWWSDTWTTLKKIRRWEKRIREYALYEEKTMTAPRWWEAPGPGVTGQPQPTPEQIAEHRRTTGSASLEFLMLRWRGQNDLEVSHLVDDDCQELLGRLDADDVRQLISILNRYLKSLEPPP